jgi:hypothetical protein
MKIDRVRNKIDRVFSLRLTVVFTEYELEIIRSSNMLNYRIQTYDGSLLGKDATLTKVLSAFRKQLGKIRNRWSVALVRTTGSVFVDIIYNIVDLLSQVFSIFWRMFFGRRKTLKDLMRGIEVKSRRVEKLKEMEFFVFASLAAVQKAILYAEHPNGAEILQDDEFLKEIEGLDFAGVGDEASEEMAGATEEFLKSLSEEMASA